MEDRIINIYPTRSEYLDVTTARSGIKQYVKINTTFMFTSKYGSGTIEMNPNTDIEVILKNIFGSDAKIIIHK